MIAEDFFELIEKQYAANLPFVVYKKPLEHKLGLFIQNDKELITLSTFREQGFVFAPFQNTKNTVLIPGAPVYIENFDLDFDISEPSTKEVVDENQKSKHTALVSKAIEEIKKSDLQKVVLSREQSIPLEKSNPINLFKKLITKYTTAFVYLWHHPQVGTWLGATPETLFTLKGRSFETMALAGTQYYNGALNVNWGAKEQEEQQLVTDEIVTKLKPFQLTNFKVYERESYRAGNLLHLRTRISGSFPTAVADLKELVKALHPTPAVCGYPRDLAKEFILNNELHQRNYYTGYLGELNILEDNSRKRNPRNVENLAYKTLRKSTQLYVNLRCMQYKEKQALVYVGGGITKDSNPEQEWDETVNKAQTIASIL